jgi:hypothetical protein
MPDTTIKTNLTSEQGNAAQKKEEAAGSENPSTPDLAGQAIPRSIGKGLRPDLSLVHPFDRQRMKMPKIKDNNQ